MASRKRSSSLYHFFVTLPDHLYPFANQVEGQWVRGIRSYNTALERAFKRYGPGHYGYGLSIYRSFFHLLGSLLIIYVATFIAFDLFGSAAALGLLLLLATLAIAYQEFVIQRRTYRQLWKKGITDWCVWSLPMAITLFFFK